MSILAKELSSLKQLQLFFFAIIFISIWVILFFVHDDIHPVWPQASISTVENKKGIPSSLSQQNNVSSLPCLILLWAHIPLDLQIPNTSICGGGCEITRDKDRLEESSAVVFMMKSLSVRNLPDPRRRKENQAYIWFNRESTSTTKQVYHKLLTEFDDYFNWTMSYRLDADVDAAMIPVGAIPFIDELYKRRRYLFRTSLSFGQDNNTKNPCGIASVNEGSLPDVRKKVKLVAWAVHNCKKTFGAQTRWKIVERLNKQGLNVDIIGKCGGNEIQVSRDILFDKLSKYKFYFAFENSFHCSQYVTEKVWYNAFYLGSLPIVWGPSKNDIAGILPAHSYIHYEDFANEKKLIEYIQFLDKNHTAYMEYFSWHKDTECPFPLYKVNYKNYLDTDITYATGFIYAYCRLCKMLRQGIHLTTKKSIPSLHKYWYENENAECLRNNH